MLPKLCEAKHVADHRVWLRFDDGVEGDVDLKGELWGEVFEALNDPAEFAKGALDRELGTIVWPSGADFAPEFLYEQLRPNFALKPSTRSGAA